LEELILDVSTEELLSAEREFTYADLYAMLGNKHAVAWLTPYAAVMSMRANGRVEQFRHELYEALPPFYFNADGRELVAWALSPEHLMEICDVVLRLLAASVVHSVTLDRWNTYARALLSAPSLAYLMDQCRSLKCLSFKYLVLDENHCRVLGGYSRPGLKIELNNCELTSAGTSALVEVLGHNQGPTKLYSCGIDYSVLVDGLRGNSRLKSFSPDFSEDFDVGVGNRQGLAFADAVRENKGLVELSLKWRSFVLHETWSAVCESLKTHPTLEILNVLAPSINVWNRPPPAPDVITSRMGVLVDMMKVNTTLHTIRVFSEHEIHRESVIPYLETNLFRPRLLAIQKTRPIAYRAKVLGRALLSARTNANIFWMLLSGNAEVAFLSRTTTIAVAVTTNLPNVAAPLSGGGVPSGSWVAVGSSGRWLRK
jgi:hypothetical protein